MRSSKVDEAFDDPEEQEFLSEVVEEALGNAHETLRLHNDDALHGIDLESSIDSASRQQRKIKFLETLHEYLG